MCKGSESFSLKRTQKCSSSCKPSCSWWPRTRAGPLEAALKEVPMSPSQDKGVDPREELWTAAWGLLPTACALFSDPCSSRGSRPTPEFTPECRTKRILSFYLDTVCVCMKHVFSVCCLTSWALLTWGSCPSQASQVLEMFNHLP